MCIRNVVVLVLGCALLPGLATAVNDPALDEYYAMDSIAPFKQKADAGDSEAMIELSMILLGVGGVHTENQDILYKAGLAWLHKMVDANYAEGALALGEMYQEGMAGLVPDPVQSTQWYNRAKSMVEAGGLKGSNGGVLARIYLLGLGDTKVNIRKAINVLKKAAPFGHAEVQVMLGRAYLHGIKGFMRSNLKRGLALLRKSAAQGNSEAKIQMAIVYGIGRGVKKDADKVIEHLKKPVEEENPLALFLLGSIYMSDEFGREDIPKGLPLIDQAAEGGHPIAMLAAGKTYYDGVGPRQQDYATALGWFKKSCDLNNENACLRAGSMYMKGEGSDVDYIEARFWMSRAAQLGSQMAKLALKAMPD